MTPVNFMPWRQQQRRQAVRAAFIWLLPPLLLLVMLLLVAAIQDRQQQQMNRVWHRQYQLATAEWQARLRQIVQRQARLVALQARWRQMVSAQDASREWFRRLDMLADSLPDDGWLTQISWQPPRLFLRGIIVSERSFDAWLTALTQAPTWAQVSVVQRQRETDGGMAFTLALTPAGDDE
ncbi:PilN domain-containing protein [Pantoea sp. 1.19]|uniref:PilN domain-containing protein n=1 Tax=Pantoea sp. 1.19 TaxID=1925589 RepID=UPI000948F5E1|nr:PilN domain-containing protein [Pantoea sp. 1.19]